MAIKNKLELEELLEELKSFKGRATELISVLIPAGYDVNAVQRQLEAEKSTAKNIKSTSTRKNVGDALDKIVRHLKTLKQTPINGLAIYCGNVSMVEGQDNLQMWDIEPPQALKVRIYRCDKEFILEPLESMLEVSEVFGLLVMDRKEATIGVLEGKKIEVLQHLTSGIPSKVRAGGQSSQRFHRITEGLTKDFYKRIADEMKNNFFEKPKLKGILVGGPIPTKDEFLDNEYLMTPLQVKVIGRKDIGNTDESGLKDLVEASQDILANQEIIHEKKLLEKFFTTLGEKPDFVKYKEEGIKKALQYGAVDTLILSKNLDKPLMKELKQLANNINSNIEVVSTETTEGEQFEKLSGMGALLRFKV
ncbi:MAG: Peptide chain release factor subunit 1 [archaeon GW2011_AR13]|nr:MAG: Peptide chain release factor subunit 1 [archaeon GW2011_AR13]HIG94096.1 peptide chain release factor 1 [Nanoarchaeota archaeon]HIH63323.1 peptide chain release factor 1 [Nanoarchaeota archaeon]HIJ09948.1 peptide chain release factor 1 [Nanoarchaeota archaeon]